jgi:peptide subunit release factor 1 (eRF1)
MDLRARLTELAKLGPAAAPVVSVYLNTHWGDEHQRDRVRVFLKNELAGARRATGGRARDADLDWIRAQGEALIAQASAPEAHGVALFACEALGLREVVPVRAAFEDRFVVDEAPFLGPLAAMLEESPATLVVFVDAERAWLIPIGPGGAGDLVTLESEVPGHHRRGGWALMAQSRYQRHIQEHRDRHFEAVTEALVALAERHGVERIVLAGESRNTALFRKSLPQRIARLVVGTVGAARHDAASLIVARAAEVVRHAEGQAQAAALDGVLTEAAKSIQAVAGVGETLDAVNRGAVHRLFVLRDFVEVGGLCSDCGVLLPSAALPCRLCGRATKTVELAGAMTDRVIATGGRVETVEAHEPLARVGGVAAQLRYPL